MANLRRKGCGETADSVSIAISDGGQGFFFFLFPRAVLFLPVEKSKKGVEGRTKRIGSEDRADLIKRFSGSRAGEKGRRSEPTKSPLY